MVARVLGLQRQAEGAWAPRQTPRISPLLRVTEAHPKGASGPCCSHFCEEAQSLAPMGTEHTLVPAGTLVTAPPARDTQKENQGTWRGGPRPTHFSLPSPTTAILLLSSVQAMSLIFPAKGWYSYLRRCSF